MTNIPNSIGTGNLPYVLHRNDEYPYARATVAIALRTVDITTPTYDDNGKLGIYADWTPGARPIKSVSLSVQQNRHATLSLYFAYVNAKRGS